MGITVRRPIRPTGWAFRLLQGIRSGRTMRGALSLGLVGFLVMTLVLLVSGPLLAQHGDGGHQPDYEGTAASHDHHGTSAATGWEGSPEGVAYSEFNHHLAGLFILVIGLSELRQALALPFLGWARFLLPGAMLAAGLFTLVWSDHEAWPIGSLSFTQTFFGGDMEIMQHKSYALLSLTVGMIELWRRLGRVGHAAWATPLPAFAIIGGLMLFGHSHGAHLSAHEIAIHHAVMGTLAVTAGSSKLVSGWRARAMTQERSYWDIAWAGLILLIGVQLLVYSE